MPEGFCMWNTVTIHPSQVFTFLFCAFELPLRSDIWPNKKKVHAKNVVSGALSMARRKTVCGNMRVIMWGHEKCIHECGSHFFSCVVCSVAGSDIVQWMIKNLNIDDQGKVSCTGSVLCLLCWTWWPWLFSAISLSHPAQREERTLELLSSDLECPRI